MFGTSQYKLTKPKSTFCASFGVRLTVDPNTSFPWVWWAAVWELDPAEEGCAALPLAFSGRLSLDPEEEAGAGSYFKGFPSKRLPTPVNGLNLGSSSAGASSTARKRSEKINLKKIKYNFNNRKPHPIHFYFYNETVMLKCTSWIQKHKKTAYAISCNFCPVKRNSNHHFNSYFKFPVI